MSEFKKAFSQTMKSETDQMKRKAGSGLAKMLTSWRAWVWLVAIVLALVNFASGGILWGIVAIVAALIITCFYYILELIF